jgi:hypothetical protein
VSWYGGWENHIPQSGRDVAAAFYAGRTLRRSSCRTDGSTYWFVGDNIEVAIAHRVHKDQIADEVAKALQGLHSRRPLEFTTSGYWTKTTARHFVCLGLDAEAYRANKADRFKVNGRYMPDNFSGWFTLEDVASWPTEHPNDKVIREARERRERNRQYRQGRQFVQMTPSLF